MPKYILLPNGKIQDILDPAADQVSAETVTKSKVETAGSFYSGLKSEKIDYVKLEAGKIGSANLPIIGNSSTKHIIQKESFSDKDNFVSGSRESKILANPSFGSGGDSGVLEYHRNFNNYFSSDSDNRKIFASELEMVAGLEFQSAGFEDLTRFVFAFDYVAEAAVYIAIIEGILAIEALIDLTGNKTTTQILNDFQMELGNYGPVNYSAITRYIHEVLRYPKDKQSASGIKGIRERLAAFYVGLSFFINTDPQIFLTKFSALNSVKSKFIAEDTFAPAPLNSIAYYLVDSLLSLSNIGNNRLLMLIRRFNQKSNWSQTKLYKAKEDAVNKANFIEQKLVELNYYYVTFIIERMHIGLRLRNYYINKQKNSTRSKLNRSGRIKDSLENQGLRKLEYTPADGKLEIKNYTSSEKHITNKVEQKQSMSISALPQAFVMPDSLSRSYYAHVQDNISDAHSNYFMEEHVRSYFLKTEKKSQRISPKAVAALEEYYEQEMMPFYFQDIRTNEILGFHAFIDTYTDQFAPQYNETTPGFGRIDKILHYVNTSRTINITFTLAAMSKEDHDLMWYQINKLVSMVYPQWGDGYKKKKRKDDPQSEQDEKNGLQYPFTQVPIASPLIRIRLGDVLKSNYSQHAISKIHGSGFESKNTAKIPKIVKNKKINVKYFLLPGEYKNLETGAFVRINELTPVEISSKNTTYSEVEAKKETKGEELSDFAKGSIGFGAGAVTGAAIGALASSGQSGAAIGAGAAVGAAAGLLIAEALFKEKQKYLVDNKSIVSYTDISTTVSGSESLTKRISDYKKSFDDYTAAYVGGSINNPITAAQETTLGKGLAGFIKSLDVNTQDQLWETTVKGSKAPMAAKINISFEPIHDIPPGLDSDGAMRAPVYNTGRIINSLYGDVYDKSKVGQG